METIPVNELRTNLMRVLKKIETGSVISITSRGREIARLVPPESSMKEARQELEEFRKTAIVKDVLSPIDETWKAMQ